jgi:tetratricopeptide (TPR) repeat protein
MAADKKKSDKPAGKIYDLYEQAVKAVYEKAYGKAIKILVRIEEEYPRDLEVLARVRAFQRICGKRQAADKSGNSGPDTAEGHYDLGVIHHNNGRFEEALKHFRQSIDLAGQDVGHVYYAMAATLARQGNGREALDRLRTAIEMGPDARYRAGHDPDLAVLAELDEFRKLIGSVG